MCLEPSLNRKVFYCLLEKKEKIKEKLKNNIKELEDIINLFKNLELQHKIKKKVKHFIRNGKPYIKKGSIKVIIDRNEYTFPIDSIELSFCFEEKKSIQNIHNTVLERLNIIKNRYSIYLEYSFNEIAGFINSIYGFNEELSDYLIKKDKNYYFNIFTLGFKKEQDNFKLSTIIVAYIENGILNYFFEHSIFKKIPEGISLFDYNNIKDNINKIEISKNEIINIILNKNNKIS